LPARPPRNPRPDDAPPAAPRRPWDRRPDESAQAFRAFCAYVEMGLSRSLAAVGRELYGVGRKRDATGRLQEWSRKTDWVARAAAFDAHQNSIRQEAMEAEFRAREVEMARLRLRDREDAHRFNEALKAKLDLMLKFPVQTTRTEKKDGGKTVVHIIRPSKWNLNTVVRLLRTTVEVGAFAHGELSAEEFGRRDPQPRNPDLIKKARAVAAGKSAGVAGGDGDGDAR
jgi:hypothetical protein